MGLLAFTDGAQSGRFCGTGRRVYDDFSVCRCAYLHFLDAEQMESVAGLAG